MTTAPDAALWHKFDAAWYRDEYKEVLGADLLRSSDDNLQSWYHKEGAFSGHSPNPYFHEEWYRQNSLDAQQALSSGALRSGFEHYCAHGYRTESPHYLFSERYYRAQNPHLSDEALTAGGYANGYDHYLRAGDKEHLSGHIFFNPAVYYKNCGLSPDTQPLSPFRHFLLSNSNLPDQIMISEHFDPVWYSLINPTGRTMVSFGFMPNLLYLFLNQFSPEAF